MECKSVQDERPRASTSGGQSAGRVGMVAGVDVVAAAFVGFLPAMANREATSLQVRHLKCSCKYQHSCSYSKR